MTEEHLEIAWQQVSNRERGEEGKCVCREGEQWGRVREGGGEKGRGGRWEFTGEVLSLDTNTKPVGIGQDLFMGCMYICWYTVIMDISYQDILK